MVQLKYKGVMAFGLLRTSEGEQHVVLNGVYDFSDTIAKGLLSNGEWEMVKVVKREEVTKTDKVPVEQV